jgi:hypothetical protein
MKDVLKIKYAEKAQVILCNPVRIEESDVGLRLRRQRVLVEYSGPTIFALGLRWRISTNG